MYVLIFFIKKLLSLLKT